MVHVAPSGSNRKDLLDERRPQHDPLLNSFIYLLSSMAVIGGFLFGYDTGIVSAAMLYIVNNSQMRPINHLWQEWIIAITPAFAAIGSVFGGKLSDKFGRRCLIIASSTIFTVGAVVWQVFSNLALTFEFFSGFASSKWILLCGRVLLGLAIGIASMVVPVYISECSPTHVRGKLLTSFNIMVCFGQMAANVVGGGFSYIDNDNLGWRLMLGFAAVPSIIQLVGFLFLPETPRWLFSNSDRLKSEMVLKKIYNNDLTWVDYELNEISATHEQEMSSKRFNEGQWILLRIWQTKHIRKALLIGCSLSLGQQLAGINTIMYYTGTLIKSAGVRDNHTTIWLSVITSGVNFIGNFIPFLVIERFGRRKVLLLSVAAVALSLLLLGTSFLAINRDTYTTTSLDGMASLVGLKNTFDENADNLQYCLSKSNCDYCVTDDQCGFCSPKSLHVGLCLPLDPLNADVRSLTSFCSTPSNNSYIHSFGNDINFEWADVFCKTKFTVAPLILMIVYLLCFSAGYAPLPWVLNAEFYPLWARSTCVSIATFTNWIINLLISVTFLSLSVAITRYGAFYLYAALTAIAWVIFYKWVPETTNCPLNEVESLFMTTQEYKQYHTNLKQHMQIGKSK